MAEAGCEQPPKPRGGDRRGGDRRVREVPMKVDRRASDRRSGRDRRDG